MEMFVLFGLPGAGKTYVGKIFEREFGYYFYDADQDIPHDMQKALAANALVTEEMRDKFIGNIIKSIEKLSQTKGQIVLAQTFLKERHRELFRRHFPTTVFVLVETNDTIREGRLMRRTDYPLELDYARIMVKNFDEPIVPHKTLTNDIDGEGEIKKQISTLLKEVRAN